jgi:starch synthase
LVTTVSQTYAKEIQTEQWGCGLQGVLTNVGPKLRGIVNGIDHAVWNPATDKHLASRYSLDDMDGKSVCKADLIRRMKMTIKPTDPLMGMVTRLTSQKGIDLIDQVLPEIMEKSKAGFVLLGSGSDDFTAMAITWMKRWPGRVVVKTGFDVKLAHRIEAGADIYLMPSKFEPCGLNQLYSLRYGTIPIVHGVGGLDDTIVDAINDPANGYGFKFREYTGPDFLTSIHSALHLYHKPETWKQLQKRAMTQDFSWIKSAKQYADLYQQLISS